MQCVWFDPGLRPPTLRTTTGETVHIEDPGIWNLEAGPDFLGAVIRIEPGARRMGGDVEVHIHPSDWKAHGHANDPLYRRVRVHVSFHPGDVANLNMPPGAVHITLRDALESMPGFDFGAMDVGAYPFGSRCRTPPCAKQMASWNADRITALLDAAGEERLRGKTERLQSRTDAVGADQALYEEVLWALGYKHNKGPFRRLAEIVPFATLREEALADPVSGYALLAGAGGLLPDRARERWDAETRGFVRTLWDFWWKRRSQWDGRCIPVNAWKTGGIRPANHPARRLMAAALLFTRKEPLSAYWLRLATEAPSRCGEAVSRDLQSLNQTYWSRRYSLGGRVLKTPAALIGKNRTDEILVNVFIPYVAACGPRSAWAQGLLQQGPFESDNGLVRQTAFSLLGPNHPVSLYRSGLRKQGLLQIFHDFCMNDRSRCATCAFPMLLEAQPKARSS